VSAQEIDAYIGALDEPKRATLEQVRRTILEIVPDAEQGLSYGAPAFTVDGKRVAGFAAFAKHLTYAPHSGTVTAQLADELSGYVVSKGSFQFAVDMPLPKELVKRLIEVRLTEVRGS
jgi:uncharacterized protein YdhG (YjbR/CyaY superfamily)